MERMDPRQLNHHAAALAVWAYAVAQLPELLPRNEPAPPPAPSPAQASGAARLSPAAAAGVAGGLGLLIVGGAALGYAWRRGWLGGAAGAAKLGAGEGYAPVPMAQTAM
jgi:hypothetical protein